MSKHRRAVNAAVTVSKASILPDVARDTLAISCVDSRSSTPAVQHSALPGSLTELDVLVVPLPVTLLGLWKVRYANATWLNFTGILCRCSSERIFEDVQVAQHWIHSEITQC